MNEPSEHDSPKTGLPFGSVSVAMVTPMRADGSVDLDQAASLAEYLVNSGCDGLVLAGTTGESSTLTDQEKLAVFRSVKDRVGARARLIAGTGSNNTVHTVELSLQAQELGMDGLLLVTPYYSKPGQRGVQAHIHAVADATALPLMLYDIPGRTGTPLSLTTLRHLAEHPRVVAIKDSSGDCAKTAQIVQTTGLAVYSGDDELILPQLALGAVGIVSVTAHLAPQYFYDLVSAVHLGDLPRARTVARRLAPLVRATMTHVPGAVAVKNMLLWQGRLASSHARLPLVNPSPAEVDAMQVDLAQTALGLRGCENSGEAL